ncbi:MAG: GNAT family N-acetyltransferase, partial [Patescibacteria group bacterium]|nr:GNAT family N-acetyltransferase [Patescibacteria group bacterium]
MKEYLKILIKKDNSTIYFGIPDNSEEIQQMFELRKKVYIDEKAYIRNKNEDIDMHDKMGTCVYFIAMSENKVIGTARIIRENILPIEKDYFEFQKPTDFKNIDSNKLVEIGRIISRPYHLLNKNLPRGIVMLGLFYAMLIYAKEQDIFGGYGAIKLYAYKKFKKLGIPVHKIENYKLKFDPRNSSDPLNNFFRDDDPVIPVYFLVSDIKKYFEFLFNKPKLFSKNKHVAYIYHESFLSYIIL